jgi:hypothetical protein
MTKTRSSPTRVAELKRWLKKNRTARCAEFVKETGGTPPQYYKMRKTLGIGHRNVALSESMKQAAIRRKAAKTTEAKASRSQTCSTRTRTTRRSWLTNLFRFLNLTRRLKARPPTSCGTNWT